MRPSRLILSAVAVTALLGLRPAVALTVTGQTGINAGNASQFSDPDDQAAHIANGGGPSMSATWADRTITSRAAATTSTIPAAPRWSNSWYAPGLIIGDHWHYPPTAP
jgi:hypothetical protein